MRSGVSVPSRLFPEDAKGALLRRFAAILLDHAHDPAEAGLQAVRAMQACRDAPCGYLSPPPCTWSALLDPAGRVAYEVLLEAYGQPVAGSMHDVPGAVMPPELDMAACGRAVLQRLHRVSPQVLIEMAILVNAPVTTDSLARARETVARVWAAGGGDA